MNKPEYPAELARKVEEVMQREKKTMLNAIGIEYLSLHQDKVVAKMPVDHRTHQPFGLLHGGASVALAESLASIGAWLNVDESKYAVVGLEINANHIRGVREGYVIGTASPIHKGRSTQVWQIEIRDTEQKLVCSSRCTLAVVPIT